MCHTRRDIVYYRLASLGLTVNDADALAGIIWNEKDKYIEAVILHLQGYMQEEIAEKVHISSRSIRRLFRWIRKEAKKENDISLYTLFVVLPPGG